MVETGGTSPVLLLGVLVFLIVLAAAILTGALLYIMRARTKARTVRTSTPPLAPPRTVPASAMPPAFDKDAAESPDPLPEESPGQPGEVMRVIRDKETGRILVEVQGQRYEHLHEIADAQAGRRVLWAIADLIRFTGGIATHPQAVQSAAQRAAQELGIPIPQGAASRADKQAQATTSTAARPSLPESRPPTPPPSAATAAPLQSSPAAGASASPRYSMRAFFQRGLQPAASTPPPGPSSFVDEIEGLLQDLIQQRTRPLPCEVHVSIGAEERLQVKVGRLVYSSADEVPDPEVQALIRSAVAAWEKR